jgi:hypothetical protein
MVIKSDYTAEVINDLIRLQYGEGSVSTDKSTWKYYRNICGLYHEEEFKHEDRVIKITSLDDKKVIIFEADVLKNNPATHEAYSYGSKYYKDLVAKYPKDELFIIGCLYPANMDEAIAAKDGQVLSYPKHLIEKQEACLIKNIESWISNYKIRWDNKQFNVSDSLYGAANLGIMYLNLVPLIINLRLKACKTNEAHSFHIRQYLASHGMLHSYIDDLNLKQVLFLYRNISYIERNNGKKEILDLLIQKFFTDLDLPVAELVMRHDVRKISEELYPRINFRRKELNSTYSSVIKDKSGLSFENLLFKEDQLTVGNSEYILANRDGIKKKLQNSLSNVVLTKVLESSAVNTSNNDRYVLTEIQLNHWLYLSSNDIFTGDVVIKDIEVSLSVLESYVYFIYLFCKSIFSLTGKELLDIHIPNLMAFRVINPVPVTKQFLYQVIDANYLDADFCDTILNSQYILDNNKPLTSLNRFSEVCDEIFILSNQQYRLLSTRENHFSRGLAHGMLSRLYQDVKINLSQILTGKYNKSCVTFGDFLILKNIPVIDYTSSECISTYSEIFKTVTGYSYNLLDPASRIQNVMVSIVKQLSSYSVQFLSDTSKTSIRNVNWSTIRLGDIRRRGNDLVELPILAIMPKRSKTSEITIHQIDTRPPWVNTVVGVVTGNKQTLDINVKPHINRVFSLITKHIVRFGTIIINHDIFLNPNIATPIKKFDSYKEFDTLTPDQQLLVKDVYFDFNPVDVNRGKIKLANVILGDILNTVNYFRLSKYNLKSFTYQFINPFIEGGLKIIVDAQLTIFKSNLGTNILPGYRLFNADNVSTYMKLFGGFKTIDGFSPIGKETIITSNALENVLEFGYSLDINYTIDTPVVFNGFNYVFDVSNIGSLSPFVNTRTPGYPDVSGTVMDVFKIFSSTNVFGGFEHDAYNITGFTYEGNTIVIK